MFTRMALKRSYHQHTILQYGESCAETCLRTDPLILILGLSLTINFKNYDFNFVNSNNIHLCIFASVFLLLFHTPSLSSFLPRRWVWLLLDSLRMWMWPSKATFLIISITNKSKYRLSSFPKTSILDSPNWLMNVKWMDFSFIQSYVSTVSSINIVYFFFFNNNLLFHLQVYITDYV